MDKTKAKDAMKELTMALLYLSSFTEKSRFGEDVMPRAWKGYDWDVIDQLYDDDYIYKGNPRNKSVYLTSAGVDYAKQILEKYKINDWKE